MEGQDRLEEGSHGACLLKRIGGSVYPVTRDSCDRVLDITLDEPRRLGMFRRPVITATDEHDVPVHFERMDDEFMAAGKPKGGTGRRLRYTTVKVVKGSAGFTVVVHPTGKRYKRDVIAREMLERIRDAGIASRLHLLDRGFFTAKVPAMLIRVNQPFIMPAVRNRGVARVIARYHEGTGKAVSRYTARGKGAEATITLAIVRKKDAKEADPVVDQYLVFATGAGICEANTRIANIPQEYRRRWGIEMGYRGAEQVRPFTCSRNPSVRLVPFYFTMVLYNVWVLTNWVESGGRTVCGDAYVRPPHSHASSDGGVP